MKRTLIALLILVCCSTSVVFSLEIELSGGLGNIAYDKSNTSALSGDEDDPGTFEPLYYPLIRARVSGEFSGLRYNFGFEKEPVLRNSIFANIRIDHEYFFMELGPVFGFLNSNRLPVNPGISAALGLIYPGIAFLEAAGSSSLALIPMEKKGNYSQISADLSAGFWVPYVICSLNTSIKRFTIREKTILLTEDESVRYFFRADIFAKNYPYTVRVDFGFQNLKRSYTSMEIASSKIVQNDITDEFKSLFLGMEGTFSINSVYTVILGAEMPIYSWSVHPMKSPQENSRFFEAKVGMIWTKPMSKNKEN